MLSKAAADKVRAKLRQRAEVLVRDGDGNVLSGTWPGKPDTPKTPGGGIDPGETAAQAAEREVAEETGVTVKNVTPSDKKDTVVPGKSRTQWFDAQATGETDDPRKGDDGGKYMRNVEFRPEDEVEKTSSARKDKDIELWEAYKKNPGPMTLQPLMQQVEPLVQSQVNKWAGAIARPVLESKGKRLALEAIKSYDPNAGAALSTHIMNRLQKLSRAVYTHQDAVRVPEYKKLKIHSYMRGQREIMDRMGREPTNDELSDHLGWSPGKLNEVQQTMRPEFIESEDFGGDMFEQQSVWASGSQDGMVDMIYYDMDPIDKIIFEHSTGYSGKPILSNPKIMSKTGLSQGQLSYRKRKIIDKIDSLLD